MVELPKHPIAGSQLAELARIPFPTFLQMVGRGALPKGDCPCGRYTFYSPELASKVCRWLENEYRRYQKGQRFEDKGVSK